MLVLFPFILLFTGKFVPPPSTQKDIKGIVAPLLHHWYSTSTCESQALYRWQLSPSVTFLTITLQIATIPNQYKRYHFALLQIIFQESSLRFICNYDDLPPSTWPVMFTIYKIKKKWEKVQLTDWATDLSQSLQYLINHKILTWAITCSNLSRRNDTPTKQKLLA